MAIVLALGKLYDDVKARFALEGPANVDQPFGWREPNRQLGTAQSIKWVPGDEGGNAGDDAPPKYPGRLDPGRPLGTLLERFTVYITGYDPPTTLDRTRATNERYQWQATRELYDAWRRAVYLAAHGTFRITGTRWEVSKNERRAGACLIVTGYVEAMIPDTTPTEAPSDAHAHVTQTELDVSEVYDVNPVP